MITKKEVSTSTQEKITSMGEKLKIDLIGSMNTRGVVPGASAAPTTDQLFENCLFYPIENPYTGNKSIHVSRRPGVPASGTVDADYVAITGFYHWKTLGTTSRYGYYTPAGNLARMTVVDSTGTNAVQTGTNGIFHVFEGYNASGTPAIFWVGGGSENTYTTIYMWADGDAAQTSITVPSGSCGCPVYADGYIFVANTDGKIYNSPLNTPTGSYNDFIDTGMETDVLVTLWKSGGFIKAFGTNSTESFEIIANTTGSPLRRITSGFTKVGIFKNISSGGFWSSFGGNPPPISESDNDIFWIGQSISGLGVYHTTIAGQAPKKVSTVTQDKYLLQYKLPSPTFGSRGFLTVKVAGRRLLLIYVTNHWLCYDIELDHWHIWSSSKVSFQNWFNTFNGEGLIMAYNTGTTATYYTWEPDDAVPYLDIDANITRNIVTSKINLGTNKYKRVNTLSVLGDRQTTASNLSVSFSGDDYANFSTARTIDMSTAHPFLSGFGMNRDWIFKFSDTVQREQRLEAIELDYDVMSQ